MLYHNFHICFLKRVSMSITCVKNIVSVDRDIWEKVFKNGLSKVCGRQPLKKFYLVHS